VASVNEESALHRGAPVEFALRAIAQLFGHCLTPRDSLSLWAEQVRTGTWWADDALYCLRQLLAHPPGQLGERIREATGGTFVLSSWRPPSPAGYRDEDCLAWLAEVVPRLQRLFDEGIAGRGEDAAEESIEWAGSAEEAEREVLAGVPFWATDVRSTADDASGEWGPGAWRVRVSYRLPYR